MREMFKKYAEEFASGNTSVEHITNLKRIMEENLLFHEEGACLEKIYNITKDAKLYEKIGDVFLYKVGIPAIANAAYNKYIKLKMPEFYDKWAKNIKSLGVNCVDCEADDDNIPEQASTLYDNYDLIVYMIICLCKNKDYDVVMDLSVYLNTIRNKLLQYNIHNPAFSSFEKNLQDSQNHLSDILSEIKNRNDINEFAIQLNPENKQAYINIIEDHIEYDRLEDAIKFYNENYAAKFNLPNKYSVVDICWTISDYYKDFYNFYDAVRLQKCALELELNTEYKE